MAREAKHPSAVAIQRAQLVALPLGQKAAEPSRVESSQFHADLKMGKLYNLVTRSSRAASCNNGALSLAAGRRLGWSAEQWLVGSQFVASFLSEFSQQQQIVGLNWKIGQVGPSFQLFLAQTRIPIACQLNSNCVDGIKSFVWN